MAEIRIRAVEAEDGDNGFFKILSQLTHAPVVPRAKFAELVRKERADGSRTTIVAVTAEGSVVATGAVMMEHKYIRGGGICGHIEDIVVDSEFRKAQLGKKIISKLVEISREKGCYKVILDCAEDNAPFYEKCGFEKKECQMALYF
ncbi:unnamed protein product [Chondrus crispus]|uniref:Glucosamine 6-phosphate N-acetyltransferase n=1 Tax=Chondrus crispus TaxID=2769 RepID=R7QDM2_CHOCR|nr:unnamed protein product [Chondrus crispus]CDF35510.1 unnamed protein product [Chondrus crispus]|eukprot:XP_005715329.1 unnamed protein product [Chondrus crispus]